MFLRNLITTSTENYFKQIEKLKNEIETAEAIVIGAGAGMSVAAGFSYSGERFERYFADFHKKYGITDMYSGGFYPYHSLEEYWAWWSRHIYINRYEIGVGKPYTDLLNIIKDREYFVLTTNGDHDTLTQLQNCADKLFHVHFSDSNRRLPGEGNYDYRALNKLLREIDYEGYVSLEVFNAPSAKHIIANAKKQVDFALS